MEEKSRLKEEKAESVGKEWKRNPDWKRKKRNQSGKKNIADKIG